jgi:hypothetical protein
MGYLVSIHVVTPKGKDLVLVLRDFARIKVVEKVRRILQVNVDYNFKETSDPREAQDTIRKLWESIRPDAGYGLDLGYIKYYYNKDKNFVQYDYS